MRFVLLDDLLLACDFESACSKMRVVKGRDSYDWQRKQGPTPSVGTGPTTDHTFKNKKGI